MAPKSKSPSTTTANHRSWVLSAVLTAFASWVGLWGLIQLSVNAVTKTLFFALLFLAIAGTMLPPLAYLNARFGKFRSGQAHRARFLRQSVWFGLFVTAVAWLQMQRALSTTLAVILLAVFVLIETFLITREMPKTS